MRQYETYRCNKCDKAGQEYFKKVSKDITKR